MVRKHHYGVKPLDVPPRGVPPVACSTPPSAWIPDQPMEGTGSKQLEIGQKVSGVIPRW